MGFAFNERTSFSLGYDHSVIRKTTLEFGNDLFAANFDRIQVCSLAFGLSHRVSDATTLSLTVAVGVTDSAPNSEITLKLRINLYGSIRATVASRNHSGTGKPRPDCSARY